MANADEVLADFLIAGAAVRDYLLAIREPHRLRDHAIIGRLHEELDATRDPLARVELRQRIIEAEDVDPADYEPAFVEHAHDWARKQGFTAQAFVAEGVPTSVLRRAGLALPTRRQGPQRVPEATGPGADGEARGRHAA